MTTGAHILYIWLSLKYRLEAIKEIPPILPLKDTAMYVYMHEVSVFRVIACWVVLI